MATEFKDIEEIVKRWAMEMFDATKTRDQAKIPKDCLQLKVNWKNVKFTHGEPVFDESTRVPVPKTQTLFKTYFTNNTDQEQEYSFKTERTTTSACEVEIESGYTVGQEMSVSLKTPCEVFEANAGFHRELTLTEVNGQVFEETLTWGVDSNIKVPAKKKTIAQLVISEDQSQHKFSVNSSFTGKVHVTITNEKDNNSFVKSVDGIIAEIMKRACDNGLKGFTVQQRTVSFDTKGSCKFRYAIEQHVELNQEDL